MKDLTSPRTLPLVLALLGVGACSGPTEIQLSADKTEISAGGIEVATITAKVILMGDPVSAGTKVSFTTEFSDAYATAQDGDRSTDAAGLATFKLTSADKVGTATVTAYFYDETTGLDATSSITITFGSASGAVMPVAGKFRLTCNSVNIGALRQPMPDIKVVCNLSAQSRSGKLIPATALKPTFLTEAGGFTVKDDYSKGRLYIYSPKSGASAPMDVDPATTLNEPSYFDKNGKKRNPRDGLVTLVAVVEGEEAFTDTNGNGKRDQGEAFTDVAEPFVDKDDDDKWGPNEKYLDANGNGKWDKANGKWDEKTKIMAIYKMLWTGALDSSSKTGRIISNTGSTTIADSSKIELVAHIVDANLNPVAAFGGNTDQLELTLNAGSSDATSTDSTTPGMKNALGFTFNQSASSERKRWLITSNSFAPVTYKFTVEDGYPADGTTSPLNYSVTATVYASPGPTETDGYYLTQVIEKLAQKIEGTCD